MTATMNKKRASKAAKPSKQQVTEDNLNQYQDVFTQITRYTETIKSGADELKEAEAKLNEMEMDVAAQRQTVRSLKEFIEGAKHGLIRYLTPIDGSEILPLFDQMEPADEELHGVNSEQWRMEPVAALKLSLASHNALIEADVMLVGQLQDRVLADADNWWKGIAGLNFGTSAAVVDRLNDFIAERSTR